MAPDDGVVIDESLAIITSGDDTYDKQVVAVLKEVVKSSIGEKILAKRRQD